MSNYNALQTIELKIDGRDVSLTEGERVDLSEIEGTVLMAGGYVERLFETPHESALDATGAEYRPQGREAAQRPTQG